jgi:hypothetical protein
MSSTSSKRTTRSKLSSRDDRDKAQSRSPNLEAIAGECCRGKAVFPDEAGFRS